MPSNISRRDYTIELSPGRTVDARIGTGVDMSDPLYPHLRGNPLNSRVQPVQRALRDVDLSRLYITVDEVTHEKEEAHRLAVNASVSYGLNSAQAAYERAHEEISKNDVMYIEIRYDGEGYALNDPQWHRAPPAERTPADSRLRQFLDDYGSHYIRRVIYGFAVTLRLARDKSIVRDREIFRAAVHAVSGALSGGGGLSVDHSRVIRDGHTNVLCVIVAGSITPENARIVSRWEDVGAILTGARAGSVQIHTGPIRAEAQSFFHTLTNYPNCRSLFQERPTMPAPTPYGVPAGTVIAWFPSAERGEAEIDPEFRTARIIPPNGWALCDGTNGTPNLVDRFVLGTTTFDQLGRTGGNPEKTHTHSGRTEEDGYERSHPGYGSDHIGSSSQVHRHDFSTNQ